MQIVQQEVFSRLPLRDESRRLFHGRGHCFSGYEDVLIDWFNPVVLITLYAAREQVWLEQLADFLRDNITSANAVLVQERFLSGAPVRSLYGESPEQIFAVENGLRYRLRLGEAQNIGFFPDMRQGRQLVQKLAADKRVLNLFAYSCSFSVAALASGAERVINVDMNRGALELGKLNHQLNNIELRRAGFLALDILRSFNRLQQLGPFELLVCDPPAYQGKSFKAERDWPKLLRKVAGLLAPGGEVVACLNGPHLPPGFLQELFDDSCPQLELQQQLQPGEDFPEAEAHRGVWIFHYRDKSGPSGKIAS